jgi:hypothetical protein
VRLDLRNHRSVPEVLPAPFPPACILVYPSLSPYERGRTSGTQGNKQYVRLNFEKDIIFLMFKGKDFQSFAAAYLKVD